MQIWKYLLHFNKKHNPFHYSGEDCNLCVWSVLHALQVSPGKPGHPIPPPPMRPWWPFWLQCNYVILCQDLTLKKSSFGGPQSYMAPHNACSSALWKWRGAPHFFALWSCTGHMMGEQMGRRTSWLWDSTCCRVCHWCAISRPLVLSFLRVLYIY